jgi:hypothetical protein
MGVSAIEPLFSGSGGTVSSTANVHVNLVLLFRTYG